MRKERVLLAHDLGGNLEDGLGALIERADQPGCGLQAVGQIGFVVIVLRGLRHLRMVGLCDQHFRQRVGIQLDEPAAIGPDPHIDIGHDRLHDDGAERETGLGIEPADLGDHVGDVGVVDSAEAAQAGEVAPRHKIEMRDQRLHGGIEAVALFELDREAFA